MSSIVHMYAGTSLLTNHLGDSVSPMARWFRPPGPHGSACGQLILRSDG